VRLAIEGNKPDAITLLKELCAKQHPNIKIITLATQYPNGAEKQLVYSVTGNKVPARGIPLDIGVVVINVATALAIYQAVHEGRPCYKRVVTVTGGGVSSPRNMWVRTGTTFELLLQSAGLNGQSITKIVAGGSMMGFAVSGTEVAITKTTNCVLVMTEAETPLEVPSECINCALCSQYCPMKLMPMFIAKYGNAQDALNAAKYGAKACIECGCCSYVCPAKIPLVAHIRDAQKMIAKEERKTKKTI
jgi:electron transport complex protein RnfC